jgi:DNA-binding SARP family transcriptional activator
MKSHCYCFKFFFVSFLIIQLCTTESKGQSYGLGFLSHGVVADQRTALDLFPDKGITITNNFQLSFEISFLPDQLDYFGYIFRIIENNNRNIDLIHDKRSFLPNRYASSENKNHFRLVIGDHFTKISFNLTKEQLFNQWNKLTLKFDYNHDQLILYTNHSKYVENHAHLNRNSNYKMLFGINNYPDFRTSDTPPVKIRNIKIDDGDKANFFWPLNEADGNIAHELINNQNGSVSHPSWIRAMHRNWNHVESMQVKGIASVAFNPVDTVLYIVGKDSLWSLSVKNAKQTAVAYSNGQLNLLHSNQSVYNVYNHTLYNYYIDRSQKTVASFDFKAKKWSSNFLHSPYIDYWHSNNFFCAKDSSLYVIGGYGQLTYKNTVQRYHIPTQQWENVSAKGDYFWPRYLAACGIADSGRTAYLLGGYGNYSGQQMLNPKNLYDLVKFDVKTRTFKKIYDLKEPREDFAFANSMIIDEKAQSFTALVFPNHKFSSHLQLFTGSLRKPAYQITGSDIPFNFYDIYSFANLFYSPLSHQLIAVTLFRTDENNSIVNVYTLSYPPDTQALSTSPLIFSLQLKYYLLALSLGVLGIIGIVYYRQTKKWGNMGYNTNPVHHGPEKIAGTEQLNGDTADGHFAKQNTIFLFGDLKLYTLTGEDITGQFTSLVRELFLAIIIYSLKSGRGISPEKLIELLWSDKSEMSAKNNRSANLSKLKSLLSQMEYVQLSKDTGNWKIEIDFNFVYIDYHNYLQIVSTQKNLNKEKILSLMEITQRGSFLPSADYPWLDQVKSEVSNEVIDIYLQYANQITIEEDPEFLIRLANCIFSFDPVNEEAMVIKCKALSHLGKHSLAKETFKTFNKEYTALYGEEFKKDFHTVLEQG